MQITKMDFADHDRLWDYDSVFDNSIDMYENPRTLRSGSLYMRGVYLDGKSFYNDNALCEKNTETACADRRG